MVTDEQVQVMEPRRLIIGVDQWDLIREATPDMVVSAVTRAFKTEDIVTATMVPNAGLIVITAKHTAEHMYGLIILFLH
jgi:hypothetical protein